MPENNQPPTTAADIQQAVEVSTAAGEAAAGAETPEEARQAAQAAARETADRSGFKLSDDDAELLANKLVDVMETRGAFESPPEPIAPPPPPPPAEEAPASPGEAAPPEPAAPQPRKTPAQRFLGG